MSTPKVIATWIMVFAVIAVVLGALVHTRDGTLPFVGVDQSLIAPFRG